MNQSILVKKEDGSEESFDEGKFRFSLKRAGVDSDTTNKVIDSFYKRSKAGQVVDSSWIYKQAFNTLKKSGHPGAAKYSMKRAMMKLGPSGFAFEKFLGEIFKVKGFKVKTGFMMQGYCTEHEIDMYAFKPDKTIIAEAKFHNQPGARTDLKVALYVQARMEDLRKAPEDDAGSNIEGWLITNTKFTLNAIRYANCAGLNLVSWSYPEKGNLMDLIDEAKLHPITCLTSLNPKEKQSVLEKGVVLCKNLELERDRLREAGLSDERINQAIGESKQVCII